MSIDLVTIYIKHTRSAPTNKSQYRGFLFEFNVALIRASFFKPQFWKPSAALGLSAPCSQIWECCCFILATGSLLSPSLEALRGLFGSSLSQTVFPSSAQYSGWWRGVKHQWHNSILSSHSSLSWLNPFSELERNCVSSVLLGPGRPSATKACYTVIHPICVLSSVTQLSSFSQMTSASSHSPHCLCLLMLDVSGVTCSLPQCHLLHQCQLPLLATSALSEFPAVTEL